MSTVLGAMIFPFGASAEDDLERPSRTASLAGTVKQCPMRLAVALDGEMNVGPDSYMRVLAHDYPSPGHASPFTEPPAETDTWWLSRSPAATFTGRRIALPNDHARALRASGSAAPILVEFNGRTFSGATVVGRAGRYELDLGDALAREMAEVLDDDDGLDVELVTGRSQPTLAIHPYVGAAD